MWGYALAQFGHSMKGKRGGCVVGNAQVGTDQSRFVKLCPGADSTLCRGLMGTTLGMITTTVMPNQ